MAPFDCPQQDQLARYLLGSLEEQHAERIENHVSKCRSCEDTIINLEQGSDTVIESLRNNRVKEESQTTESGVVAAAVARIRAGIVHVKDSESSAVADEIADLAEFGQYELVERIGRGGMGSVYRATHTRLDKPVAIKVVAGGQIQHPDIIARFEREMKAVGKLDHVNLVRAFDAGETEKQEFLFLVMELLDGLDASKLLRERGPLPVPVACEIIRQACFGLKYIHAQGQVHRDIKPSNLMVTREGTVKILDLGLALLADTHGDQLTSANQLMGTLDYMSPEQAGSSHEVTHQADVYSLGCTLFALLSGRAPFDNDDTKKPTQKIVAHTSKSPPSLAGRSTSIPGDLSELVQKMLAKRPDDRPSLDDIITSLTPLAEPARIAAIVDQQGDSAVCEPIEFAASPATNHVKEVPNGRSRFLWVIAITLLLLLSGAALAQVIVIIKNGNKRTRIEVAEGEHATISGKDGSVVKTQQPKRSEIVESSGMYTGAIVTNPAKLRNAESFTVETRFHRGPIFWAEFRPDGKQVATVGADQTVRIWDTQSGEFVCAFPIAATSALVSFRGFARWSKSNGLRWIKSLAWSGDGTHLAVAADTLSVWNVPKQERVLHVHEIGAVDVSWLANQPQLIVKSNEDQISVWDVELTELKGRLDPTDLASRWPSCSPDGKMIAAVSHTEDDKLLVVVWELKSGEIIWKSSSLEPWSRAGEYWNSRRDLVWAPAGESLALSGDNSLYVWDMAKRKLRFQVDEGVDAPIAWSRDGSVIFDAVGKLDAHSGERLFSRSNQEGDGRPFIFSPTGDLLLRETTMEYESTLDIWDIPNDRRLHRLQQPVLAHSFLNGWKNRSEFVFADRVWNIKHGRDMGPLKPYPLKIFQNGGIPHPCYSPNGDFYATAAGGVQLFPVNRSRQPTKIGTGSYIRAQWSNDGSRIFLSGPLPSLWDPKTGEKLFETTGDGMGVHARMTLDGNHILFGSRAYNVADPAKPEEIVFPTAGRVVELTANPTIVRIWTANDHWLEVDLTSGKRTGEGKGTDLQRERAFYGLHSPGGDYLAFLCHSAGTGQIYDFKSDRLIGTIVILAGGDCLAVSPDGHVRSDLLGYERQIVYVVQKGNVYLTLEPPEFAREFRWKNEPAKVFASRN